MRKVRAPAAQQGQVRERVHAALIQSMFARQGSPVPAQRRSARYLERRALEGAHKRGVAPRGKPSVLAVQGARQRLAVAAGPGHDAVRAAGHPGRDARVLATLA